MAKKSSKKKSTNPLRQRLPLVLSLLAAAIVLFFYFRAYWSDPIANSSSIAQQKQTSAPTEIVKALKELGNKTVSHDSPALVRNYTALYHKEDLSADGRSESFLIETNNAKIHRSLRRDGFTQAINRMQIYTWNGKQPELVFSLDPVSIRGKNNEDLIDQVRAEYGYALSIDTYANDEVYSGPVKVFTIVMIDEKGKDSSDPLSIYYQPSSSQWKVTNMFEGPGTF
jgi:hypothetical protein